MVRLLAELLQGYMKYSPRPVCEEATLVTVSKSLTSKELL